jgi:hypothetical protein
MVHVANPGKPGKEVGVDAEGVPMNERWRQRCSGRFPLSSRDRSGGMIGRRSPRLLKTPFGDGWTVFDIVS